MLTFGDDTDNNGVRLMEKKRTGAKLPTFSVLMSVYRNEQPIAFNSYQGKSKNFFRLFYGGLIVWQAQLLVLNFS